MMRPNLQAPGNEYVAQQETFVADVADADAASKLYKQLCIPAVDADSLTMQLPLLPVRARAARPARLSGCWLARSRGC